MQYFTKYIDKNKTFIELEQSFCIIDNSIIRTKLSRLGIKSEAVGSK